MMRRTILILAAVFAVMAAEADANSRCSLRRGFANPPDSAKPWCYWLWLNGHTDRETITSDLEAVRNLGFGGVLMFDMRGYWNDDRHVVNPPAKIEVMSPEWQDLFEYAVREASRLKLEYSFNVSLSGGKLDGPWPTGADAPKWLVYRLYPADAVQADFGKPDFPHYWDIAVRKVWYKGKDLPIDGKWHAGGDGIRTMAGARDNRKDSGRLKRRMLAKESEDGAKSVLVRFGYAVMPGFEREVDVLDPLAVEAHFNRMVTPLLGRLGGLAGAGKTLTHLYSVSWEGAMPTWTHRFVERLSEFRGGRDVLDEMPLLACFETSDPSVRERFVVDYRRVRNGMLRSGLYGKLRSLCHANGLKMVSESGGPWVRSPATFREADQLAFLGMNDMPQGEFWPKREKYKGLNARPHLRGAVAAAHVYGLPRASIEAFTHMDMHWSVDPGFLKSGADESFVGGINHFVWHTFTCSPRRFGVPGMEYFAGSHVNRNTTWHKEASHFVGYLGRCQWMLQRGVPVTDYAVYAGDRPYMHWGLYLTNAYDGAKAVLPSGYTYDVVNDHALLERFAVRDGRLVLPEGVSYGALVWDPEFPDAPVARKVLDKVEAFKSAGLQVFPAAEAGRVTGLWKPDFEGPFMATHRRDGNTDIYFVIGEGRGCMTFRESPDGRSVELWDAVSGACTPAEFRRLSDGRTGIDLDLPKGGSVFVVFAGDGERPSARACRARRTVKTVDGPWKVSFKYMDGIEAPPPESVEMTELKDFTSFGAPGDAGSRSLRYFSGTAFYRAEVILDEREASAVTSLSVGEPPSGLARVYVNGKEAGVAWCGPWSVRTAGMFRPGRNEIEIRYVNNWKNRLIGDCILPESGMVTKSTIHYWRHGRFRGFDPKRPRETGPTRFSGYAATDDLQPSGLAGPVKLMGE